MTSDFHSTILRLAGQTAYDKGEQLFQQNAVLTFNLDGNQISAQVQDAYVYDVKLSVVNDSFDGGCTCPVSEGFDFCEHCVAVALHHHHEQQTLEKLLTGEPADRVKGYLKTLKKDDLADELYKFLSEDADKFNQWVMFADITRGDFDVKDVRKRIVKAMPLRDVWRYQQVRNYFDKARKHMALVLEVIDKLPAENAFKLCLVALTRYDKILERIDDSGGFRFGLFHLIERHFIKAFKAIEESDANKHARLVSILDNDFTYIDFADIGAKFIPSDNVQLQEKYYKTLDERLKKRTDKVSSANSALTSYANSLANYHEKQGNLTTAAEYAFLAKPTFIAGYVYLAKLIAREEYAIAQKYLPAVKALAKSNEDHYKVNSAEYDVKKANGEVQEALTIAWSLFESSLSVSDLNKMLILCEHDQEAKQHILDKAETRISSSLDNNLPSDTKDYTPLLDFYIATNRLSNAVKLTQRYEFLEDSLHELAYACLQHRLVSEGVNIYKRLINHYVLKGQIKNYQIAIDLLLELIEIDSNSNGTSNDNGIHSEVNSLINDVCFTHASKQQFMKMFNVQIHSTYS